MSAVLDIEELWDAEEWCPDAVATPLRPSGPFRPPAPGANRRRRALRAPGATPRHWSAAGPDLSEPRGSVRITRRGRLVVTCAVVAVVGVVVTLAVVLGSAHHAADSPASVVVGAGDTLWQIATEVAPAAAPGDTVEQLRSINDLGTGPLHQGQVLRLPAS